MMKNLLLPALVAGTLLIAWSGFGCRREPAVPENTPSPMESGQSTQDAGTVVSQPAGITPRQAEVLKRIEEAGGVVQRDERGLPVAVDLASDRVFADAELVQSMAEFPHLHSLRLAAVNVPADAFRAWTALSELTELFVQDATLSDGELRELLASMPKLQRIGLRRVGGLGDELVSALTVCPRLSHVALIELNAVTGATLGQLPALDSLRGLDIRNCGNLFGDDFAQLHKLPALSELRLAGPAINDDVLRAISVHPGITALVLEDAEVTGEGLAALAEAPELAARLQSLALARCFGVSDDALAVLHRFPCLESLALRNILITGSFVEQLAEATPAPPPLRRLTIAFGFVGDAAIERLPAVFPELVQLDLRGNRGVTDASRTALQRLTKLREVSLEETGVSQPQLELSPP